MIRELKFEEVTNMENLYCYNHYDEDQDYSERDEIKLELQGRIQDLSHDSEFEIDSMLFTINNDQYIFYACDEFITLHIVKDENVLIATQNPNEIIEFVKTLI